MKSNLVSKIEFVPKKLQVAAVQKPENLEQSDDSWQNKLRTLPYDTEQSRSGSKPLGIKVALLSLLPLRPQPPACFPHNQHPNQPD